MSLAGTTVRKIQIVEALGEGGMGELYVGLDQRLGRRVAVKVVRPERRMDARAKARFLREARILSQLEHPNICRIYEFIEEGGADHIILELVAGADLRSVAPRLGFQAKLEIAEQVASALVAAHSVSVVHRDLKPENVMVDAQGRVKVLDFGLARDAKEEGDALGSHETALESRATAPADPEAMLTEAGDVMGTLRYMSPEQARGERATAASDMYSFGLLLQEIFTGARPYPDGLSRAELQQKAMWGDTLPVTGVDSEMTALIERLKSLAARDRPSAVETAERLRSLRERPRRRLRRIAIAAVAVGLLIAATASALGLWHARRSLALARSAQADAVREAAVAREVSDFLVGVFSVSDPGEARGNAVTAREILDAAAERIERELGHQPLTQARLMDTMGRVYRELGLYQPALKLLERAVAVRTRERGRKHPEVAASEMNLAEVEYHVGHWDRAESLAQSALETREGLFGPGAAEVAPCLNVLGAIAFSRGDHPRAATLFRRAIAIIENTLAPDHPELADPLVNLGVVLKIRGDLDGAKAVVSRALAVVESATTPDRPRSAALHGELAAITRGLGAYDEARKHLQIALDLQQAALGPDHPDVASVLRQLALSHSDRGEFDRAEALLERSLAIIRRTNGPRHRSAAWSTLELGLIRRRRGDYAGAEALVSQSIETSRASVGARHPETARGLSALGLVAQDRGDLVRAEELTRQALGILVDTRGPEDGDTSTVEARLARILAKRGKLSEAKTLYEHSHEVHTKLLRRQPANRLAMGVQASVLVGLGELAARAGDDAGARALWSDAVEVTKPLRQGSFGLPLGQEFGVKALLHLGHIDEARPTAQRLLAMGWSDPDFRRMCREHGITTSR